MNLRGALLVAVFAGLSLLPLVWVASNAEATFAELDRTASEDQADRIADALGAAIERDLTEIEERALRHAGAHEEELDSDSESDSVHVSIRAAHGSEADWAAIDADSIAKEVHIGKGSLRVTAVLRDLLTRHQIEGVQASFEDASGPSEISVRRTVRRFPAASSNVRPLTLRISLSSRELAPRARSKFRLHTLAAATLMLATTLAWMTVGFRTFTRSLERIQGAAQRIARGERELHMRGLGANATLSVVNRMAEELRVAQERAKRAERIAAWRDIARRIAHEIKNPLTPIRMSIETLRRARTRNHPDFGEIFEESTTTVLEEVQRLERIVTEFSRFARLPRPAPERCNVAEMAEIAARLFGRSGEETTREGDARLPIAVRVAPGDHEALGDRDQIAQVLANLLRNATDACRSNPKSAGRIEVHVGSDNEGVRVVVEDDGPGIPEERRADVLEPYFTTKAHGTGLGLPVVDRIISDHGGTLSVGDSERLGGARISFTLPREGPPTAGGDTSHGEGSQATARVFSTS